MHEIFFQVFDKGWMEDGEGRFIDFRNTIIILTSNVGTERVMQLCRDPDHLPDAQTLADALRAPLLEVFPAALLGRLQVVPYYPLTDAMLARIVGLQLRRIERRLADHHRIGFTCAEEATALIVERCRTVESGGRMVDAILNHTLLTRISTRSADGNARRSHAGCHPGGCARRRVRLSVRRQSIMSRIFTLEGPLADTFKFYCLEGEEALARSFEFRVNVFADNHSLSLADLLGKPVTVRIEQQDAAPRYLNGLVARAQLLGRRAARHYGYALDVRAWIWLATHRSDCRIFQNKTVPQIIREVLTPYGHPLEDRLSETYVPREYCVQYNETDAAFVSRLMETEGIYYYFKHSEAAHALVLCDAMGAHDALPGYAKIPFIAPDRIAIADREHIDSWEPGQAVSVGTHQANDYDYMKPRADLLAQRVDPRGHDYDGYAIYEWPGNYRDEGPGMRYGRVRLEELQAEHERASAHTDVRGMAPGYLFTLEHCPRADQNRQYLLVSCRYSFQENPYASDGDGGSGGDAVRHDTHAIVQPQSLPYRSPRVTPRPRTNGPQTATVVGPKGEEIWTDQHGRVKLQFRWDRYGQFDENSSCWVRVSSPWAGSGFGGVQIPRIGDEVVVDFLNGDPDYPIITGRVYNGERMPPWGLPANATQSGLLSRSSPGGALAQANALRFEDRKGAEQLWMHAERNLDVEAELDHTVSTGRDHAHTVGRNETVQVQNDRAKSIGSNETVSVKQHRTTAVGVDDTTSVGGNRILAVEGDSTHTVAKGNHVLAVASGNHEVVVKGNSTHVVQAGSLSQEVAQGSYTLAAAQAIQMQAAQKGVAMSALEGGVDIEAIKDGMSLSGAGKTYGVQIFGTGGGPGVQITGEGKGVSVCGQPDLNLTGTSTANLQAPLINLGNGDQPCTVAISATKIVLSTTGGSITLDGSGVVIEGTIAHIN